MKSPVGTTEKAIGGNSQSRNVFRWECSGGRIQVPSSRPYGTLRFSNFYPGLRRGLSSARPVQIRFFKLANLASAGAFGDPKSSGNNPSNEGHGFSRAVNSRRLTASAAEVRFSRATGAKSSLSRLSFSSRQLENVLTFRRQRINRTNPIWFRQALFKAINKLHRQTGSCSANLDSSEVQPSLRDSNCNRFTHPLRRYVRTGKRNRRSLHYGTLRSR
jgi:hypothetical protein